MAKSANGGQAITCTLLRITFFFLFFLFQNTSGLRLIFLFFPTFFFLFNYLAFLASFSPLFHSFFLVPDQLQLPLTALERFRARRRKRKMKGRKRGRVVSLSLRLPIAINPTYDPSSFSSLSLPRRTSSSAFDSPSSLPPIFRVQTSLLEFWPRFFPTTSRTHRFRTVRKSRYPGFGACKIFQVIGARRGGRGCWRNLRKLSFQSVQLVFTNKDGTTVGVVGCRRRPVLSRDVKVDFVSFRFVSVRRDTVQSRRVDNYLATNTSEKKKRRSAPD